LTTDSQQIWVLSRHLRWRHWDDEWVAYDTLTGDTHLFDSLTACVLHCLEENPASLGSLVSRIADQEQVEMTEDLTKFVESCVYRLHTLDILESESE
jgi:PqqD family protein of HPr-rel-A system